MRMHPLGRTCATLATVKWTVLLTFFCSCPFSKQFHISCACFRREWSRRSHLKRGPQRHHTQRAQGKPQHTFGSGWLAGCFMDDHDGSKGEHRGGRGPSFLMCMRTPRAPEAPIVCAFYRLLPANQKPDEEDVYRHFILYQMGVPFYRTLLRLIMPRARVCCFRGHLWATAKCIGIWM